jgi:hypothetical protein
MKTVGRPDVVRELVERLTTITPESVRQWGSMTPHEMLCHLGDATDMVLGVRPRPGGPIAPRRRPLMKFVGIWSPLPWPRGLPTSPFINPKADGTRPSEFARDRARAIAGIEGIAAAVSGSLEPAHRNFGTMSLRDWQRWAYRHTDHHLRQFGC